MTPLPLWLTTFLRSMLRRVRWLRGRAKMAARWLMDLRVKKRLVIVLSLDQLGPAREVSRQAILKGFRVHVFSPVFPVLEAPFAHNWSRVDSRTEFDRALAIARILNPDAILLEEKNLLLPMQNYLANSLGLRSVGDKAVETSNSKIALRRELDAAGIHNVPWIEIKNYTRGEFEFPCIVKPDLGTASKGVRLVSDHEDLIMGGDIAKNTEEDPSVGDEMLLEAFVAGRQFDLEGVAVDGHYHLLCVVEEHYADAPPYFPPSWFHFNPPISDDLSNRMWETTQKALRAVGVKNGSWHMEQRVDGAGRIVILDYANRMGYNLQISEAAGISFAGSYVDIMVGNHEGLPSLKPRTQLQIYAFDSNTLDNIKRLIAAYPLNIFKQSLMAFEFSFHIYKGHVAVQFDNYAQMKQVLEEFDLLPNLFSTYYSPDDRS